MTYLSDLEPSKVEETPFFGLRLPWRRDVNLLGEPLKMNGQGFERGLAVHSRCVLTYDLDGRYATFEAIVGFDDAAKGKGRVDCRVFADGKELYADPDLRADGPPKALTLPVSGAEAAEAPRRFRQGPGHGGPRDLGRRPPPSPAPPGGLGGDVRPPSGSGPHVRQRDRAPVDHETRKREDEPTHAYVLGPIVLAVGRALPLPLRLVRDAGGRREAADPGRGLGVVDLGRQPGPGDGERHARLQEHHARQRRHEPAEVRGRGAGGQVPDRADLRGAVLRRAREGRRRRAPGEEGHVPRPLAAGDAIAAAASNGSSRT